MVARTEKLHDHPRPSALDVEVLLRELHAAQPEILVLAGSFEQEIQIMRARRR
jgi:hypothetical protein